MVRSSEDTPDENDVSTVASDWLARFDRGLTVEEEVEFENWIRADPRHLIELGKFDRVWHEFDRLTLFRKKVPRSPNPDLFD